MIYKLIQSYPETLNEDEFNFNSLHYFSKQNIDIFDINNNFFSYICF